MTSSNLAARVLAPAIFFSGLWLIYQVAQLNAAPIPDCTAPVCATLEEYKDCDFEICYYFMFSDCRPCDSTAARCEEDQKGVCGADYPWAYRGTAKNCLSVCNCFPKDNSAPIWVESKKGVEDPNLTHYGDRHLCQPGGVVGGIP